MGRSERLDQLAGDLARISDELAEAAMDLLRAGLEDFSPAEAAGVARRERLVNRARASVDKAVGLLAEASVED